MGNRRLYKAECNQMLETPESERLKGCRPAFAEAATRRQVQIFFTQPPLPIPKSLFFHIVTQLPPKGEG
jgi:hypothetical protein